MQDKSRCPACGASLAAVEGCCARCGHALAQSEPVGPVDGESVPGAAQAADRRVPAPYLGVLALVLDVLLLVVCSSLTITNRDVYARIFSGGNVATPVAPAAPPASGPPYLLATAAATTSPQFATSTATSRTRPHASATTSRKTPTPRPTATLPALASPTATPAPQPAVTVIVPTPTPEPTWQSGG